LFLTAASGNTTEHWQVTTSQQNHGTQTIKQYKSSLQT